MWKKFFGLAYPMGWVNKIFGLGLSIGYERKKKLRSGNAEGPIKWKFHHVAFSIGYRCAGKFRLGMAVGPTKKFFVWKINVKLRQKIHF